MDSIEELLPDPVLENVGRHLPLGGMRTCRLVCKRWAAVIGESVTAVGVSANLLRSIVLSDNPGAEYREGWDIDSDDDAASEGGSSPPSGVQPTGSGPGADRPEASPPAAAGQPEGLRRQSVGSHTVTTSMPSSSSSEGALRPGHAAAMRRLRRLSRRLARAFPRAHTCVIHIDIGYGDHAAPDPHQTASRLAALLGGLPNLARIRLAMKALGADDSEVLEPEEQEDMDFCFTYTLRLLQHLLLRPPPPEARALPPTAAALRRRRAMLPAVPWPPEAPSHEAGWNDDFAAEEQQAGPPEQQQQQAVGGAVHAASARRHLSTPCWGLELHLGALPRIPAAWSDLAALPQLATLLLPVHRPRLPAAALPHIALLTGLRALQLSVAGAAASGGVGLLAGPGMAVQGGPEEELWERVASLSALTGLTHLGLHGNALPTKPLSRALAALTNLRDLFIAGHVTVDVEQLAHPGGLTALERLALPQQLLLWEVELLATHCRRLRHIEICGTWEGCCWEGGITGFVMGLLPPAAAGEAAEAAGTADEGGQPQAGGAAIAGPWGPVQLGVVDDPHDTNDEAGEEEAEGRRTGLIQGGSYLTAGVAAGSRQTLHLPTWLTRQLAAAGLWQRLLLDGWHAMPCFQTLDATQMPRGLVHALGTAVGRQQVGPGGSLPVRWSSVAQLCVLLGLHRALHGLDSPLNGGDDGAALAGLRLRSCMHFGCNVSSIALLGAVLDSARRVPGYDPSDVVVMESSVPAGALDQVLDEVYGNELPEPEWDGLDGEEEDQEVWAASTLTGHSAMTDACQHASSQGGDDCSQGAEASAAATASRPLQGEPGSARQGHRAHKPKKPQGITSVYTWVGVDCCLGPLGALLPELRTLNIALPPSMMGLVLHEGGDIEVMLEAAISFGDSLIEGTSSTDSQQEDEAADTGGHQEAHGLMGLLRRSIEPHRRYDRRAGSRPSAGDAAGGHQHGGASGSVQADTAEAVGRRAPLRAAPAPRSHFMSLRHLSIGNLASPNAQWEPSIRLGNVVLTAIGEGLPSLETLQLDGVLCFTGEGLSRLSALTRLKELAMHHWMNTLTPMRAQLLRVPVASLPPGLTSLHAMHVQLQPDWSGQHTHASQQQQQQQLPDPGHLLSVFGELQELDWTHCDHATADKLLEVVLPHCTKLQLLHLSGPGAFYHTPLPQAFEYGVTYGLEAGSLFMLPFSRWLPALLGRTGGGGTWLRHLSKLPALTEIHLDLPLMLPSQVCELVDALVARGSLHSLALHGVAISLITRRDWVVKQLSRLASLHLQNINVSFGRHTLAAIPGWLRGGDRHGGDGGGGMGGGHRHRAPPLPDPKDTHMLQQLAAAFSSTPEAHFVMHSGEFEESVHAVPWGLPVPEDGGAAGGAAVGAAGDQQGNGAAAVGGAGPVGEGAEQQQQQQAGQVDGGNGDPEFQFPLAVRLMAHLLAMVWGPMVAVKALTPALAPIMGANELPAQWQLQHMLMDLVAPHDPERVQLPQAVLGWSRASWTFAAGACCALGAVCAPVWTAVASSLWQRWRSASG